MRKTHGVFGNVLARYEIHVANYYFKRGAYLAAANRGGVMWWRISNYTCRARCTGGNGTGVFLLQRDDLAQSTVKVLASNFPTTCLNKMASLTALIPITTKRTIG